MAGERDLAGAPPTLLCVANFPPNTGYAWDYIEGTFARMADALFPRGVRTLVAYPRLDSRPKPLQGSAARPVALDASLGSSTSLQRVAAFCRRENVQSVYLIDRPAVHPAHLALRAAGVRRIVVHDHTSGDRALPQGLKRAAKWLLARAPGLCADRVLGVSDFVLERQLRVAQVPAARLQRVYNAVEVPPRKKGERARARAALGIADERPLVFCAGRATPEKGVAHLLRAFDRLVQGEGSARPRLIYVGDGPHLSALRALHQSLAHRDDIQLLGYRPGAAELLPGADVCVVPSVWQEAFGLAVAEPMARGCAVVASRVGGIPEIIEHGRSGLLVSPGDEAGLAEAIGRLLTAPDEARRLGRAARERIRTVFSPEQTLLGLLGAVAPGLSRVPAPALPLLDA